jgi:hypothetical protein
VISVAAPRSLAAAAALAVALGGLLPAPHLHTGQAGTLAVTIVHAHAIAGPVASADHDAEDHDHAVLDHSDHAAARAITQSYHAAARFDLVVATEAARVFNQAHDANGVRCLSPTEIRPTHDPPLRFTSSPAPPAVV